MKKKTRKSSVYKILQKKYDQNYNMNAILYEIIITKIVHKAGLMY